MKIIEDIAYGSNKSNMLDLYIAEKENAPVFIYFHGGGLENGSYKGERKIMEQLAKKGINAVSAEYRMYPEAKFPEFLQDAANAVSWVKNNLASYTKYSGIYVGGSSAGGYITQMLCFDKQYLNEAGVELGDIAGFIHDAGQPTTHFRVLMERGICKPDGKYDLCRIVVDDAAPVYHINGSEKYPPMKFIVSDRDFPNRYEQTLLIMATMKSYGYDMDKVEFKLMENSDHCSYLGKYDENGENLLAKEIYGFINK